MSTETHTQHAPGVFETDDSRALRRIYAKARRRIDDSIAINEEIERRLALIVLYTYGTQALASPAVAAATEGAIAQACVDRLLAQTAAV